jgi:hypothetical protein
LGKEGESDGNKTVKERTRRKAQYFSLKSSGEARDLIQREQRGRIRTAAGVPSIRQRTTSITRERGRLR